MGPENGPLALLRDFKGYKSGICSVYKDPRLKGPILGAHGSILRKTSQVLGPFGVWSKE